MEFESLTVIDGDTHIADPEFTEFSQLQTFWNIQSAFSHPKASCWAKCSMTSGCRWSVPAISPDQNMVNSTNRPLHHKFKWLNLNCRQCYCHCWFKCHFLAVRAAHPCRGTRAAAQPARGGFTRPPAKKQCVNGWFSFNIDSVQIYDYTTMIGSASK